MPDFYHRVKKWALGLPWYIKWIGIILLILVAVAGGIVWIMAGKKEDAEDSNLQELDDLHKEEIKDDLDALTKEETELRKQITKKKVEIYKKLNQADKIDAKTIADRKRLEDATTMEELDRLQEEMGL